MSSDFVGLHNHSSHSFLDGYSSIESMVRRAVDLRQGAVAVTDHQEVSGHLTLQKEARKAGIKPVFGMEGYLVDDVGLARERKSRPSEFSHITLLAQNQKGLSNLWAWSTDAYTKNFYHRALMDWDQARQYAEGLYASDGCLLSYVADAIIKDDEQRQHELIGRYLDTFGDRFFMELHTWQFLDAKTERQIELNSQMTKVNQRKVELAQQYGIPLTVVNDAHYASPEEWEHHDLVWRMNTKPNSDQTDRGQTAGWMMGDDELVYFMQRHGVSEDVTREAIKNSHIIAHDCNAEIEHVDRMPRVTRSDSDDLDMFIRKVEDGFERKVVQGGLDVDRYGEQMRHEAKMIASRKFTGYFNVVADYIKHCKNDLEMFVGPGRGSSGGSLVAWLMDITEIDPLKYGLMFERFISEDRKDYPDVDTDFPQSRLQEVKDYKAARYGGDHVCGIGTLSRSAPKGILKDLARATSIPFAESLDLSKELDRIGADSWDKVEKALPDDLAEWQRKHPDLFDKGRDMVGMIRQSSTHASGFLVSSDPLLGNLPLRKKGDTIVSQFDMNEVEELGFIKFDLLGLRHCDTIDTALKLIRERHGIDLNPYEFDEEMSEPEIWEDVANGDCTGLFQLEAPLMASTARRFKPQNEWDVAELLAANRPGVIDAGLLDPYIRRRHGIDDVSFDHPMMEAIVGETHGILLYQEQLMQASRKLAGFDGSQAERLRKAVAKKHPDELVALGREFRQGCLANQTFIDGCEEDPEKIIERIWRSMEASGAYAFNKSHSFAYALISSWEAWLRHHYRVEYIAALLSTDVENKATYVRYARRSGIEILPPDINLSSTSFSVTGDNTIRYGLDAVKYVGGKAIADIIRARQEHGPFESLRDMLGKVTRRLVNKRVVLSLIRIGAFDSFDTDRNAVQDDYLDYMKVKADDRPAPIDIEDTLAMYRIEKELVGGHILFDPLGPYESQIEKACLQTPAEMEELNVGAMKLLGGIVGKLKPIKTRKGDDMAFATITYKSQDFEVVIFPDTWRTAKYFMEEDIPVICRVVRMEKGCQISSVENLNITKKGQ